MAKKHKRLPQGVSYAQVLAEEKRKKDLQAQIEREAEMQIHTEIFVQRALWLSVVSIADAYGYGPKRLEPYFEKLKENGDEFDAMCEEYDYDYALEKTETESRESNWRKAGLSVRKGIRGNSEKGVNQKHGTYRKSNDYNNSNG